MSPALALLPIVSKKTDLILTLVMTNSESWIVLLSVVSHTVISAIKMHQKIDAIFVDDGVAHYHIVYDDGDEEEVYRDEAIALLLAANGFD